MLIKFKGPLLIIATVILANLLYVSGSFQSNPAYKYSGLAINTKVGIISGSQPTIDPNNAYTTQALGHAAARQLRHGNLPWWNYDEQVGAPLAGEMQSAALFLPFILLLGLAGGVLIFHMILQMIAGIATYYLLRHLACRELVSTLGGALFALNGTFTWITNAAFNPIAFLPLLLLGIEILFSNYRSHKNSGWILIAVALAFSLYAGFPETAFFNGLLATVWAGVRFYQLRREKSQKFLLKALLGLFVGLCLAAPILVAFKDYYPYANVGSHAGGFESYSLPVKSLPALFMPYTYGPIFAYTIFDKTGTLQQFWGSVGGYTSLSLLFLALVGVFTARKNKLLAYVLGAWVLVTVGRTYGFPGLDTLVNLIPGVTATAFFRYIPPTFELALIVLAMFGLEVLLQPHHKINKKTLHLVGWYMVTFVIVLLIIAFKEEANLTLAPRHNIWLVFSTVFGIVGLFSVIASSILFKRARPIIIPLIVLTEAFIMFAVPHVSAPRSAKIDMAPVTFLKQKLGNDRFYSLGPIMPNYSSYYGISSINTNNLPISKNWSGHITKKLNPNVNPIGGFTGVDMVDPNGLTPPQAFIKNIQGYEDVGVKYVLAFKGTIVPAMSQQAALTKVFDDDIYEIYRLPATRSYYETTKGCQLNGAGKAHLSVNCPAAGQLVRKELFMPGWQASVNGKPAKVTEYGDLFQQINLKAGKSDVSFTFLPPGMKLAGAVALTGLLIIIGASVSSKYYLLSKLK